MAHLLAFLRERGVIPALVAPPTPHDPFASVLRRYDEHLRQVRGLSVVTCATYLRSARGFLSFTRLGTGTWLWTSSRAPRCSTTSPTRSRGTKAPRGGGTCALSRVASCASCTRRGSSRTTWRAWCPGRRDRAVLLLIATLGLCNKEVRCLALKDVRWLEGAIHLPWTKAARARAVPLPKKMGEALADYVLHERPALAVPQVFLRHKAPSGPFTTSGAVANIVRRHLKRAGIASAHRGAHLLRHSLATRLVNEGVPIKAIADVLGHVSINTTAIYTKVDTTHLAAVALPFPEGA